MSVKEHLGLISAVLACGAAATGLAYAVTRHRATSSPASSGALAEFTPSDLYPYIQKAEKDLAGKTLHQIQVETAHTWGGRACAAVLMGRHDDAHEYAHEAIEHAALSGDMVLLRGVREAMRQYGVEV